MQGLASLTLRESSVPPLPCLTVATGEGGVVAEARSVEENQPAIISPTNEDESPVNNSTTDLTENQDEGTNEIQQQPNHQF